MLPILIAFFGVFVVYWRENKKQFQEKIFELKINAYKEIIELYGTLYEDFFNFLDTFQEFTGTQNEWEVIERPLFVEYFKKGQTLRLLIYRYGALLPESIIEKMNDLTSTFMTQSTTFNTLKSSYPHDYYGYLETKLYEFIADCRQDLQTDALNTSIFKRISYNFYPIDIKSFKKRTD